MSILLKDVILDGSTVSIRLDKDGISAVAPELPALPEDAEVMECSSPYRKRGRILELTLRGSGVTAWKFSWRIGKK